MTTVYDYYKDAAERHLETCNELRKYIAGNFQGKTLTSQEEKKQRMILANIYYLSGYVIECIVNYGILKHIKFETKRKKINELTSSDNKYGVAYSQGLGVKYSLWEPNHSLTTGNNRLHYFKDTVGIKSSEFDKIPFLNGKKDLKQDVLVQKWGAKVRYEVDSQLLNTNDIFGFQTNSEKIYNGMINHIIPKL